MESRDLVAAATQRAWYAEALHLAGATEEALATLHDALPLMERRGERLWTPNALALEGDLLCARGRHADAEVRYRTAIEVARGQSAKWMNGGRRSGATLRYSWRRG